MDVVSRCLSEEFSASIFRVIQENGGSKLFKKFGIYVYSTWAASFQEDSNFHDKDFDVMHRIVFVFEEKIVNIPPTQI
jgi:hypothetical protein